MILRSKGYVILLAAVSILIVIYYQTLNQCDRSPASLSASGHEQVSEIQNAVKKIYHQVDQIIPKTNVTDIMKSSSAKQSKVFVKYPKDSYCVGDQLVLQVDMFDHLGQRKTYGGDFLRARMSTKELDAAASGRIEDFKNGSYHVHFILFWEGTVDITVFMMHPSEGASALWIYRNKWHGYVDHVGKFEAPQQSIETVCGFDLDRSKELCEYKDERDEEYFYCIKPENFSCNSLSTMKSWRRHDRTLFTDVERGLFNESNVRVKIPKDFDQIRVIRCNASVPHSYKTCKIGAKLEYPSGYVMRNIWYPKGCKTLTYNTLDSLSKCFTQKFIYIFGDSTVRLWMQYFQTNMKTLLPFNHYEDNWARQLLGLDVPKNLKITWKRHTFPFISGSYQSFKEERTIAREIDLIGGDKRTVIVLHIGMHFRAYPIYYFIRRLYNVRRAIERLLIRSPETKVIIKTENTSAMSDNFETMSDYHALVHYFIMDIVFKDLNVGFVNGWDMTNAFDTNETHPPKIVTENEIKMLMTYIC
ncbi:NXPE family member 2-like isoform X1 [Engystomops pustulosus]|uniref:NXPE family member 2-like isoform X1 n=2 Tax=Engystomops pustulosus TaxID=76066 RepID=UPI003AFB07C4